jgi:hypothetical protein
MRMWIVWTLLACGSGSTPVADPAPPVKTALVDTGTRDKEAGLFRPLPDHQLSDAQRTEIEALEAIGYVDGEVEAPSASGVTRHEAARVSPGPNLWTSGHEAEAYLMDAGGTVLHTWRKPWDEVFDAPPTEGKLQGTNYWRRAYVFPNGDLLAIFEGQALIKLDRDSNVLWTVQERIHHDLEVLDDGTIVTLGRVGHVLPRLDPKRPVLEDFVLVLSPDGVVQRRVSLLAAVENSDWASWFAAIDRTHGDLFHTNSLEVLDGSIADAVPAFTAGRVLTSFRSFHAIAVLDLDLGQLVWAARGPWKRQHDPGVLPNGHLLLFDNMGAGREASAVRELDPATLEQVWSYEGTDDAPFFSKFCGAAQRLPNGNTLVSDTWVGRAFETTPDGTLVWEFLNPHRAGSQGRFIAVLPEMVRLPPDFPTDWIPPHAPTDETAADEG